MKHLFVCSLLLIIVGAADVSREGRYGKGWDKHGEDGWDKEYESPSFSVLRTTPNFEERLYPSTLWVCTNLKVDTAADPLWGLERRNFLEIMKSERFKTQVPASLMFWPLFRYIRGENARNESIAMTKGVTTAHIQIKEDDERGDVELQEMCFYLESKFQAEGSSKVPAPTDASVYVVRKPELAVFVRQFPGWAFTAATWLHNRDILQEALDGEDYYDKLYLTTQKSHPWVPEQERVNEIMIPRKGGEADVRLEFTPQPK